MSETIKVQQWEKVAIEDKGRTYSKVGLVDKVLSRTAFITLLLLQLISVPTVEG